MRTRTRPSQRVEDGKTLLTRLSKLPFLQFSKAPSLWADDAMVRHYPYEDKDPAKAFAFYFLYDRIMEGVIKNTWQLQQYNKELSAMVNPTINKLHQVLCLSTTGCHHTFSNPSSGFVI